MQRYFVAKKEENNFILNKEDLYHIKTVMRMKNGDSIEVVYQKELYLCSYQDQIAVPIKKIESSMTSSRVTLIIPLVKEQKMDYILQKSTELGVEKIIPYYAEHSVIKIDGKEEKKLERWRKIVKEASEQSKRLEIPEIPAIYTLKQIGDLPGNNLICSTREKTQNIKKYLTNHKNYDRINIVIGPEGGLSLKEEEYLCSCHFTRISLGNYIMRVETVPLYLLSVINYENME